MSEDIHLSRFETDLPMPDGLHWSLLHDWSAVLYGNEICLEGTVSRHSRLDDGSEIRTSPLARIARDRSWCQTRNTIYKLAEPAKKAPLEHIPDALRLILCSDHEKALQMLAGWTRWSPQACTDTMSGLLGAIANVDACLTYADIRRHTDLICSELARLGEFRLHDLWHILRADPDDWAACCMAANLVGAAFSEWNAHRGGGDDATARRIRRIVNGWHELAKADRIRPRNHGDQDPITLAREIGDMLAQCEDDVIKDEANERESKLLDPLPEAAPAPEAVGDDKPTKRPGLIVIAKIGGNQTTSWNRKPTCEEFRALEGQMVPLIERPDLTRARATLAAEFPHASPAIDAILSDLVGRATAKLRPTILAGDPGTGKSRFARRVAEALGIAMIRYDGAGSNDASFAGCARHWSTAEPCVPLAAILSSGVANPLLLIDEIDKAGDGRHNGNLGAALLPFLEIETAARHADPYIQAPVDLSHVSYMLTCNDLLQVPSPLRDRMRIVRFQRAGAEHIRALAGSLVDDLAKERDTGRDWIPDLDADELHIAAALWKDGSMRRLRAIVERILARRDEQAPRH